MKTKRDIVTGALVDIRVADAVETVPPEDYDLAARRYDALHATLRDDGLCYWPNTNNDTAEIPDAIELALINLLVGRIARAFGKEEGIDMSEGRPLPQSVAGMRALRRHVATAESGEATYFSDY